MTWTPHATVSVVVEHEGRFLMVEERSNGKLVFNQPSGHVEEGELFEEAAIREALEETGYHVQLNSLIGLYTAIGEHNGVTYHRLCYTADIIRFDEKAEIDSDIVATHWLTHEELLEREDQMRSPMVLACINDYKEKRSFPLNFVRQL